MAEIHETVANVVVYKMSIGDVATQYFDDRNMFCAGCVSDEDLKRTMKACGGAVMTTANDMSPTVLGKCEHVQERQIGGQCFTIFQGCPNA